MGSFSIIEDQAGLRWQIKGGTDDCVTVWKLGERVPQTPYRFHPGIVEFGDGLYHAVCEVQNGPQERLVVIAQGLIVAFEPIYPDIEPPRKLTRAKVYEWWHWFLETKHGCQQPGTDLWTSEQWAQKAIREEKYRQEERAARDEQYFTDRPAWQSRRYMKWQLAQKGFLRQILPPEEVTDAHSE